MTEEQTYAMLNTMGEMGQNGASADEIATYQLNYWIENSAYFGVEHIDFHFLMKPLEYYNNIVCATFPPCLDENQQQYPEYSIYPSEEYSAPNYWADPTSQVPLQGIHWEPDNIQTKDEFLAEPALAYGTYDGKVMFLEVMYSLNNLRQVKANGEQVLDFLPGSTISKWEENDVYIPTLARASYADGKYTIELTGTQLYSDAGVFFTNKVLA